MTTILHPIDHATFKTYSSLNSPEEMYDNDESSSIDVDDMMDDNLLDPSSMHDNLSAPPSRLPPFNNTQCIDPTISELFNSFDKQISAVIDDLYQYIDQLDGMQQIYEYDEDQDTSSVYAIHDDANAFHDTNHDANKDYIPILFSKVHTSNDYDPPSIGAHNTKAIALPSPSSPDDDASSHPVNTSSYYGMDG